MADVERLGASSRTRTLPLSALIVVAMVALVSVARWALHDILEDNAPYILFIAAVAAVSYWCGWKAGAVAALLSLFAGSYLFTHPLGRLAVSDARDWFSAALFLFASGVILWAFAAEEAAQRRVLERDAKLRRELVERARLEDELQQARRLDSVGQLAGGIAHDFNNLLTVVLGNSEILARKLPQDPQVESITFAATRGAELTRQLLGFAGRQMMSLRVLSLNEAVLSAQRFVQRLIPENIRIALELSDDPCLVEGDPTQIQQVLINLITVRGCKTASSSRSSLPRNPAAAPASAWRWFTGS